MRSISGGCVAHSALNDRLPSPNSMWLTCRSLGRVLQRRTGRQPGDLLQRIRPGRSVCRVNCTDDASASHSRCRDTAAWISCAKNCPTKPRTRNAIAMNEDRAALAVAAAPATEREHAQPDQAEQQDAGEQADQPHVDAHVAVEDVAELVPDHALQLVAVEPAATLPPVTVIAASAGRVAGGERVDALLAFEHEQPRHRHARRDRHLLDHVDEAAQLRIGRRRVDRNRADRQRDRRAAGAQRDHLRHRAAGDDQHRHRRSRRRSRRWCCRSSRGWSTMQRRRGRPTATIATTASMNSATSLTDVPRADCWRVKKSTAPGRRSGQWPPIRTAPSAPRASRGDRVRSPTARRGRS